MLPRLLLRLLLALPTAPTAAQRPDTDDAADYYAAYRRADPAFDQRRLDDASEV